MFELLLCVCVHPSARATAAVYVVPIINFIGCKFGLNCICSVYDTRVQLFHDVSLTW